MTDPKETLERLSVEQKAALVVGASAWTTVPLPDSGVEPVRMSDGPHGVRFVADEKAMTRESEPATCFPTAVALASSWDVELVREVGAALGAEAAALGVDVLLGPGVNIKRTPLGGRNFEYFSEDPYLAGELAVAWIDGLQSRGVGASVKHFALNNQEFQRNSIDVEVDERALREIYLPAFEAAVTRARPWTVMCAYNRVGGALCSQHPRLLDDVLKREWGFDGLVVSDWGAVRDRAAAVAAGLDLEMPGPRPGHVQEVLDALADGRLALERLDEAVARVLRIAQRAQTARREAPGAHDVDVSAHHRLARRAAQDGMVLLKNDDLLPLTVDRPLAVIGRTAKEPKVQGGGSSRVNATRIDDAWSALLELGADLRYAEGWAADLRPSPELVREAVDAARQAEAALVFVALPGALESEGYDRTELGLPAAQVELIQAVAAAQPRTAVVLNSGGAVDMRPWLSSVPAVLQAWTMGQAGGGALAEVLMGRASPSGKLAETFPLAIEDTPAFLSYPGENGRVRYDEGLFVGYRYYDARRQSVLFPFGHGLSYTTFAYQDIHVSEASFDAGDTIDVSFSLTNTGAVAGSEVAQLYVHDAVSRLRRPPKELKGFAKVSLEPGETQRVTLRLDMRSFAYYDPTHRRWVAEAGDFELLVGASSTDIRLRARITLAHGTELPFALTRESSIREWLADTRGKAVLEPLLGPIRQGMAHAMGSADESQAIGMDLDRFLMDMPLVSLFGFQESEAGMSAAALVDDLLARGGGDHAAEEAPA
ncbi:MAG: glycoside hydrolase family 3 C-terminal domain-containing protein [Deinococcales bacterium]